MRRSEGFLKTMEYYNKAKTQEFIERTLKADVSKSRDRFIDYVLKNSRKEVPSKDLNILDAGCGSGRDTKVFLEKGFSVAAFDASNALCIAASEYTGIEVECSTFMEIDYENEFDGIWASASLLHVEKEKLIDTVTHLKKALKKNGIFYASFKKGDFSGIREGRFFQDATKEYLKELFGEKCEMEILELYEDESLLSNGSIQEWVNVIAKKIV